MVFLEKLFSDHCGKLEINDGFIDTFKSPRSHDSVTVNQHAQYQEF